MPERIKIKRTNKVVDVFFGKEGWEPHEHTRLLMVNTKNGVFLKYLSGAQLSNSDFNSVKEKLACM